MIVSKRNIADGVADHAIVPLIYEGRFVEQNVDEENIDLWFDETTRRLTEEQKADLSDKWSTIRRLTSTDARIRRIALDINRHFIQTLQGTEFKAMLACNYKKDAVRYLNCFEALGDLKCAVVISAPDVREGHEEVDESTDDVVCAFWEKMMKEYGDPDTYEETLKEQFKHGEIDIMIVCSKLLTGFDAPLTQVLYIDKELKEHGLLQAIARTNRLYDGKDFGWIIDYRGLLKKLDYAMEIYGLNGNIASKIGTFNKYSDKPKNISFWTIEEFKKFMSVIDDEDDYLLFRALYFTGMRIGEAIALTWHDFDGTHLIINKTMAKEKDKDGNYIVTSPKTLSSNRIIELDKKTIQLIKKKYSKDSQKTLFNNDWYIFRNSKPLTQTTVGRKKNNYCELSRVKKIRLHDFRHSHATFLLSHGIPVTVIAQRLGQSDLMVTLNTYIHLVPNDEIRAINLIDSFN